MYICVFHDSIKFHLILDTSLLQSWNHLYRLGLQFSTMFRLRLRLQLVSLNKIFLSEKLSALKKTYLVKLGFYLELILHGMVACF